MRYFIFFLALLIMGCSEKRPIVITKIVERNTTIPTHFFKCIDVVPMKYDENSTNSYQDGYLHVRDIDGIKKHSTDLKTGYDSCKKQMEKLKERYGK